MDVSKIESKFLKENQLVGLGFPIQGYVFLRCTGVENIIYNDYVESPASIAADTYEDPARLPIAAYNIDNLLKVEDCDHVYQVFMGWSPGAVRQYLYYPMETSRRNLDVKPIYQKSPFGYVEGFDSTKDQPSPDTELFIPQKVDVAFAWWNPLSSAETVSMNILIRRMQVDVIRDADLIDRILKGSQPCRLVSLGGIESSFNYNAKDVFDVDFVKLGAAREEIDQAVAK